MIEDSVDLGLEVGETSLVTFDGLGVVFDAHVALVR